ncbi:MAG TPA: hypothetical protein VNI20_12175 [Fimbriimonadaceae bacterium]|nr:hypothetical protein [Fimbriimonadaceae bacterium]
MTLRQKREIFQDYQAIQAARARLRTVDGLARDHGISRQRVYQIVREIGCIFGNETEGKANEDRETKQEGIEEVQSRQTPTQAGEDRRATPKRL